MDTVFHVLLMLRNPTFKENEEDFLQVNLMFAQQPTVDDILDAFAMEPQLYRRTDFSKYKAVLIDGLETYGVPVLHRHHMVDGEGYHIAVPRVTAKWVMNMIGRSNAESDIEYGSITVCERIVHTRPPQPVSKPAPVLQKPKKAAPRKPKDERRD